MNKSILLSAMQPTGNLTIGNYLGVLCQWKNMQKRYTCIYCIADLHALTVRTHINTLRNRTLDTLALYLALGIDPDNSIIFIQSHVYEHCQLNWILNCYSYFGELTRMTQFKSKSKDDITNLNAGLFSYPILMASDVLLYQSDKVLVGLDQKQHLEFIIRIAKRFNNTVGEKIFTIPAILLSQYSSKIMSLLAPRKKMSKSDTNKNNTIFLLDSIHSIKKKISHAITDSDKPAKIYYDTKNKPGISNLLTIFSSITGKKISELEIDFSGYTYSKFKKELSEVLSIKISKLQKLYLEYRQDESLLEKIANEGAIKARHYAQCTIKNVYKYLNLMK